MDRNVFRAFGAVVKGDGRVRDEEVLAGAVVLGPFLGFGIVKRNDARLYACEFRSSLAKKGNSST